MQQSVQSNNAITTNRMISVWNIGRSLGAKFFILCLLALLAYIPLTVVHSLQAERAWTAKEAAGEIGKMSGGAQNIRGPFIQVPFLVDAGEGKTIRRIAVFLPDDLTAKNEMTTEIRYRSIFQVPVYRNAVQIRARFKPVDMSKVSAVSDKPLWDEAVLVMGITDTRGIVSNVAADFGQGKVTEFQSGIPAGLKSGIHAPLKGMDLDKPFELSISMQINGSASFSLSALGKTSLITMQSNWPHPSFKGQFLPERREIDDNGFSATWRSSALARTMPAAFLLNASDRQAAFFSDDDDIKVELYTPADMYQRVHRALKYGVLFIGGMFLSAFGLEAASRTKMHAAQYVLFGLALVLFYVLLLSLAEHIGFDPAYGIASLATTTLTAVYVGMALRSAVRGSLLFAILAVAYGIIYMLLRMEDYALLIGSIAIFIALAILMFTTLRTDWSASQAAAPPQTT